MKDATEITVTSVGDMRTGESQYGAFQVLPFMAVTSDGETRSCEIFADATEAMVTLEVNDVCIGHFGKEPRTYKGKESWKFAPVKVTSTAKPTGYKAAPARDAGPRPKVDGGSVSTTTAREFLIEQTAAIYEGLSAKLGDTVGTTTVLERAGAAAITMYISWRDGKLFIPPPKGEGSEEIPF